MDKIQSINIQSCTFSAKQNYHLEINFTKGHSPKMQKNDDGQPNFISIQQDTGSIHQLSRHSTHMYMHIGQTSRTY